MDVMLEDFRQVIANDPRADYIMRAGGVVVAQDDEEIPLQQKTPYIVLIGRDAGGILHWSSRKRWMPFLLDVMAIQRIFDKEKSVLGSHQEKGVSAVARDMRFIVDMNRSNGKYARVFLREEGQAQKVFEGNKHLLGKTLTFEIVRIE